MRVPITDVASWIEALPDDSRRALVTLGELLAGVADHRGPVRAENAERFTRRGLGVHDSSEVLDEDRELTDFRRLTVPMALGPLIAVHSAELGPDSHTSPPAFTQTEVGGTVHRHPQCLRAIFPAGSLLRHAPVVIGIEARSGLLHVPRITAYVRREHQSDARRVLDSITDQADQLNPYRGRILRASMEQQGVGFKVIDIPSMTRSSVVVDESIWREVDLGLAAVRDHHSMLNAHGLGSRRGLLLVGPPGTGKSAVSAVAAREALQSGFTVIYVEAKAGERLLTAVVEEAQRLGGPVLMILEDVDLVVRDRRRGNSGGLSEFLQAMDVAGDARILTLASTNDANTLDAAAIRSGRFDSVVKVDYPDQSASARILAALVRDLPGQVDTGTVAAQLPEKTSGSDLREIVRRAVLSGDGAVTTAALIEEVGAGRYLADPPSHGQYL